MMTQQLAAPTFLEVYLDAAEYLLDHGEDTSPRQLPVREAPVEIHIPRLLDHDQGIILSDGSVRQTSLTYLAAELRWYLTGVSSVNMIEPYAKMWGWIANDDGTANSAYGHSLFRKRNEHGVSEWEWARSQLGTDPHTRRAVMMLHGRTHHHWDNKDVPCTMYIVFHPHNRHLNTRVHMRSSDVWYGLTYDIPFFMLLQRAMARQKGYWPGSFTLHADNMHIYEKNLDDMTALVDGQDRVWTQKVYPNPKWSHVGDAVWWDLEFHNPTSAFTRWVQQQLGREPIATT